ncbi:MAG TPA: DUF6644 family protein [Candidatus Acidoferrales bacterium]|jgi:uncharacterized membrane protein|nr:DUF6644 family protein [Candidatus Acidoferrales bacterium]
MLLHLCRWLQENSFIAAVNGTDWSAATVEIVHYFSMFILVGSMVIVDLRILGLVARRLKAAHLADRLFSWMWIALGFNFLSGFLMFAGSAPSYYGNSIFYDKLLVVALAVVVNLIVQLQVSKWDAQPSMPAWAKLLAIVSIGLWVGAIIAGVEVPALTGVG